MLDYKRPTNLVIIMVWMLVAVAVAGRPNRASVVRGWICRSFGDEMLRTWDAALTKRLTGRKACEDEDRNYDTYFPTIKL